MKFTLLKKYRKKCISSVNVLLKEFLKTGPILKILNYLGIAWHGFISLLLFLMLGVMFAALILNPRSGAATYHASHASRPPSPTTPAQPLRLKIVTFNIADGYLFTTNRPERMRAIGELLTKLDPDVVGIQESFIQADRKLLLEALSQSRLRYRADYPAATLGNGLLTLSAYPIVEARFHRFRHNNPWYKMHQGDWWVGKGVGLARIALPSGCRVDFYNLHAQPDRGDTDNLHVRSLQMDEVAAFIKASKSDAAPALVVGDFNTSIEHPDLRQAMRNAGMKPAVTMNTGIDSILAVDTPKNRIHTMKTTRITGTTQGTSAAIFLSRAPTPREIWHMHFGPGETTPLSDHDGFMSTIAITNSTSSPTKQLQ
jgi:endonuclease/exonuclease/phosphatase family metal-dependent hydrolase